MSGGSIYKRKDGYWVAQLQVHGKRQMKYAKSKREAQAKLAEMQRGVGHDGTLPQPGTRALDDVFGLYFQSAKLRPTTLAHYQWVVETYISPAIGKVRLSKLDASHLQAFYATLDGPRVPSKVHRLLHRALKEAVQWDWLASNPADRVAAPTYQAPRKEVWNEAQLQAFLKGTQAHKYGPFWMLALATGLRLSELMGLQWQDVDLEGRTLTVERTRVKQRGVEAVLPPKTRAGERTLALPPQGVTALRQWKALQAQWRSQAGGEWPSVPSWVFTNEAGRPLPHGTVQKSLQDVCKRLDLPLIGTHGLRHLHATLLLSDGLPVPAVSARLGHANPQVTMTVYAHALPQQDREAASVIDRALEGTG